MSGSKVKRKKKDLIRIFKSNELPIAVKTNLKVAALLDVHFDLIQEIYRIYEKMHNDSLYIKKNSNHPPTVIKLIP